MTDDLICEFPIYQDTFTGKVEHVDLTDIDRAVAGFAQGVMHCQTVTDIERKENKEFARFSDRPANTKVYSGAVESDLAFVKKLVAKFCGGPNGRERNEILPACYITRDQSFSFAEAGDHVDAEGVGFLSNSDGVTYAKLSSSNLKLTYTLTCVAWSKPTLERMVLGFLLWLRFTKLGRPHTFKAKTKVAGGEVELDIAAVARNDIIGEAGEITLEETRIVSNRISFDVIAEVIEAQEITRTEGKVALLGGNQIE